MSKLQATVLLTLLSLLLSSAHFSASAAEESKTRLVLTGARVLDADGRLLLDGTTVRITGDLITAITQEHPPAVGDGSERLDLTGLTLIPGLIDLHTHLLLHPYNETSWTDQVLREQLELRTIRGVLAARATLEAGFTTIRELGTEGAGFADVALRDAIAQGMIPGPRVYAATRALVASGSYGPSGFDPRWQMPVGAQVADGVAGVLRATREQIAAGADWIKIYADYRRRPGGPSTATFSATELEAIVSEAHTAGLSVAAHASTDEAIRRAVNAGVQTIEHGYGASDEVLALMREHGVVLCPTLAASAAISTYTGWQPGEPDPPRVVQARQLIKRALASGVTIALGSDVGVFSHGDNAWEVELLVDYGMTPEAALRAATVTAASVLGRADDLGRLAPGYTADLVAVEGDPLTDISSLRRVKAVIQAGRLVVDRR